MKRRKYTTEQRKQFQQQALSRAQSNLSFANYPAIIEGFLAMGIPLEEIKPRENVLSYAAWRALNRTVKKGEHGVKVTTWIDCERKEKQPDGSDKKVPAKRCTSATVFHVSQTCLIGEKAQPAEQSAESRELVAA